MMMLDENEFETQLFSQCEQHQKKIAGVLIFFIAQNFLVRLIYLHICELGFKGHTFMTYTLNG